MKYKKLKVIELTDKELIELWRKEYCSQQIYTFDGMRVKFFPDQFNHVFYESSKRNVTKKDKEHGYKDCLSYTRLEKMLWIKDALIDEEAELHVGYDKKTKSYNRSRRVAVAKDSFVVVIYIIDKITQNLLLPMKLKTL